MKNQQQSNGSLKQGAEASSGPVDINAVEIHQVNKWFGEYHALRNVSLDVGRGERLVICGPSGSGKSTLIRCINRLERHDNGTITVNGIELTEDLKRIEEIRRDVGMVFQSFNLFPHLTVLENCTLAPTWVRKMPKAEANDLAMEFLHRVRIPEQASKYPGQLSGGQQQRVAIARALCMNPKTVSYTHLRAHETVLDLVCRLLLEKKKKKNKKKKKKKKKK
eukprot:TRINITY_DN18210_c0_g1_i1.p1 TRINITY_DN18210_c0_g1~~TRINITY_DN18210_c0_g1_i1.p1  ORF type:complete len:221 (+),score=51.37 TRINITY_DN18210_c0_g1_i1:207-869(+)